MADSLYEHYRKFSISPLARSVACVHDCPGNRVPYTYSSATVVKQCSLARSCRTSLRRPTVR